MNSTQCTDLHRNLSEIYLALTNREDGKDLNLFAYDDCTLYFKGSCAARVWEKWSKTYNWLCTSTPSASVQDVLNGVLDPYFWHSVRQVHHARQERIRHHIHQLDDAHSQHPTLKSEQKSRYAAFFHKELLGSVERNIIDVYKSRFDWLRKTVFTAEEVKVHRHKVINFYAATAVFWRVFIKDTPENQRLREPLKSVVKSDNYLFDRPMYKAIKKEVKWVQLEGITHQSIPVAEISKLHAPNTLTVDENRRLTLWAKALNDCRQEMSFKHITDVIEEVIKIIEMQGSSSVTLQDLIIWLDQQGCSFLHAEDPSHMDWREGLIEGSQIECNGKQFTLGKQLSSNKDIDDEFKIYELKSHPDFVVKIARNKFRLAIDAKQAANKKAHWGVRLVETIKDLDGRGQAPLISGLDASGRCVILEKLNSPISDHVWKSNSVALTSDDEKIALILASHLYCMNQWKASAEGMTTSHLLFDAQGVLKSTHLLKKGPPNYNVWEEFCIQAAKENVFVIAFLMNVSKLIEHPVGCYYRDAVVYVIEKGVTDLLSRPLPKGHNNPIYNKRVEDLCKRALELRKACLQLAIANERKKGSYTHRQEQELQGKVVERLVHFYKESSIPGALFEEELRKKVLDSLDDANFGILDDQVSDYYSQKRDLLLKRNLALSGQQGGG
jgi:hypothetical protein